MCGDEVVVDLVCEVGEEGLPGLERGRKGERIVQGQVSGVVLHAEGIDDEEIEILEESQTGVRNDFDVAHISKRAPVGKSEEEAEGFHRRMLDGEGRDGEVADREGALEEVDLGAHIAAVGVLHGPGEHAAEGLDRFGAGMERKGIVPMPAEGAQLIEAGDVIEMGVSVEDGIDFAKILAQGLFAEIGTGVDEDRDLGGLEVE